MCNPTLDGSQETKEAEHINAMTCSFDQPHHPAGESLSPRRGENRVEVAVLEPSPMRQTSGLADQTNTPALSFDTARKRQIIRSCKVAGIDEDDSVGIKRHAHRVTLFRGY